jgi:hypothetical protein
MNITNIPSRRRAVHVHSAEPSSKALKQPFKTMFMNLLLAR